MTGVNVTGTGIPAQGVPKAARHFWSGPVHQPSAFVSWLVQYRHLDEVCLSCRGLYGQLSEQGWSFFVFLSHLKCIPRSTILPQVAKASTGPLWMPKSSL